jgi:ergothioneine biosynthesis protein EgtB
MEFTTMRRGLTHLNVDANALAERFRAIRTQSIRLADPLSPEDLSVQIELCASPGKWHLAHTTWFFEEFVLQAHEPGFAPYDDRFVRVFNSYYHSVGVQHPRALRGALTRPGLGEVLAYRDVVDERILRLLDSCPDAVIREIAPLIELGLQHEQQHQELLLTDIKLLFAANPLRPSYVDRDYGDTPDQGPAPARWIGFDGGVIEIGHDGDGFAYDNEGPRHRRFLEPFELRDRPATNRDFAAFIDDGGYTRPELWLDDGWKWIDGRRRHPRYWSRRDDNEWSEFTLSGERPLRLEAPVSHLSFYEADAFARWSKARLPTEAEWEHAAQGVDIDGNFVERREFAPIPTQDDGADVLQQMFGDVWEWTRSAHEPYPGYAPPEGAIGEYNGKFMCNSFVLRGGSCATPRSHIRRSYRNFFDPGAQWQFSGVRLARSTT